MNNYPELGDFLRRSREKKGFFQAVVATKLGVSQQHVSRWEEGIVRPRYNDIGRIADLLSICPIDILLLARYNIYTHKSCEYHSAETQRNK